MNDTQSLLDEALRLGDLELQMLSDGELEEAEKTAMKRSKLIQEALQASSVAPQRNASQELQDFKNKLGQLMTLQGRLTSEARKLHKDIRSELLRTRQESTRLAGYGKASSGRTSRSMLHKRS